MITILDESFDIRVICIDRATVSAPILNILEPHKMWEDLFLEEDIYDPYDISEVYLNRHPELRQIVTTCVERNAQYFRLIHP